MNNVVFMEAAQLRAGGVDVYYGAADSRIGALHLTPKVAVELSMVA
jgi:predicted GH43/DUF377 family glycosyl hydrolase